MVSADLRGKAAIVTGGASGIGLAAVRLFAQCGATVALNDLPDNSSIATQVDSLKNQGLDVLAAPGDVGRPAEARRMVDDAVKNMGRLDYLINNAGGGFTDQPIPPADLDSLSDDLWGRILDVNLKGAFHCTHAASGHLKLVEGAVVNNASTAGLGINQGSSIAYAASKAALSNLTRGLAKALGPTVRVNAVAPGHIKTPRTDRLGDEHRRRSVSRTALQRPGPPRKSLRSCSFSVPARGTLPARRSWWMAACDMLTVHGLASVRQRFDQRSFLAEKPPAANKIGSTRRGPQDTTGRYTMEFEYPVVRPTVPDFDEVETEFREIFASKRLTTSVKTEAFEAKAAQLLDVDFAVAVSSCTAGLVMAMRALDIAGEVIIPSYAFNSCAASVLWAGLKPVLCDCRESTLTLDVGSAEQLIGEDTAAIMPVAVYGMPPDVLEIESLSRLHGMKVIYDSAMGLGARYREKYLGGFGDVEVFSLSTKSSSPVWKAVW